MEAPTVRLSRFYPVPPEVVFKAWTDATLIAKWFAPSFEYSAHVHQFEPTPGGRYRIEMRHVMGAGHIVAGEFLSVDAPRLLEMSFAWEGAARGVTGDSRLTIQFVPEAGGTLMTFVHDGLESFESAKNHESGWTSFLGRLRAAVGHDPTRHVAVTLAQHTLLFHNALDGMSEEHLVKAVGDANPAIWIAAHIASTRAVLAQALGEVVETPLAELEGALPDGTPFPTIDAVISAFGQAKAAVYRGLHRATDETLAQAVPRDLPFDAPPTMGELLDALVSHEAYHIGQLSVLRRVHGYPAMSYKAREPVPA